MGESEGYVNSSVESAGTCFVSKELTLKEFEGIVGDPEGYANSRCPILLLGFHTFFFAVSLYILFILDSERTGRQQGPDLSNGKDDPSHTPDFVFGVVWGLETKKTVVVRQDFRLHF